MIAVVDTGGANLASIVYALARLNVRAEVTADPATVSAAERVILPGVGAAPEAARRLRQRGLGEAVQSLKVPVLAICLGMQLYFDESEEGPAPGLGILPGSVRKILPSGHLPVPHMGWNRVRQINRKHSPLMKDIEDGAHFYFVHSYQAPSGEWTLATCDYGAEIPAVIAKDNFHGVQFHPERSGAAGAQILRNFIEL